MFPSSFNFNYHSNYRDEYFFGKKCPYLHSFWFKEHFLKCFHELDWWLKGFECIDSLHIEEKESGRNKQSSQSYFVEVCQKPSVNRLFTLHLFSLFLQAIGSTYIDNTKIIKNRMLKLLGGEFLWILQYRLLLHAFFNLRNHI